MPPLALGRYSFAEVGPQIKILMRKRKLRNQNFQLVKRKRKLRKDEKKINNAQSAN